MGCNLYGRDPYSARAAKFLRCQLSIFGIFEWADVGSLII